MTDLRQQFTPWPLHSRMDMATLESLNDLQLAELGLWREGHPKPVQVGAVARQSTRAWAHRSDHARRRSMVR